MTILVRTALFVPGNRPDRIDKAYNTEADVIIIDLEDAVPLSEKKNCRPKVKEKLEQFADRFTLLRVNGLDTPFIEEDLNKTLTNGVDGIIVPKVEKADDVYNVDDLLTETEEKQGIPEGTIRVFPLIESAAAVQHIYEIVSAKGSHGRVYSVAFGAADYTLDMGIEMTHEGSELFYARSRIAIACRAAGVSAPIDTPYMLNIKDIEGLISDAKRAKNLGFQGKLVIHPQQIAPCNRIFSPTQEEIDHAKKIVKAFEAAEATGSGGIQVDGKFVDYPIVKRCRDILILADTIDKKE